MGQIAGPSSWRALQSGMQAAHAAVQQRMRAAPTNCGLEGLHLPVVVLMFCRTKLCECCGRAADAGCVVLVIICKALVAPLLCGHKE